MLSRVLHKNNVCADDSVAESDSDTIIKRGTWESRRTILRVIAWDRALIFAEGLRGELLIVPSLGDHNVHDQGAELLINRLVELGKPFDFMEYPGRTHSLAEGKGTHDHVCSLLARNLPGACNPWTVARVRPEVVRPGIAASSRRSKDQKRAQDLTRSLCRQSDARSPSRTAIAVNNANLEGTGINADVQGRVPGPRGFQSCWAGSRREDILRNSPSAAAPDRDCLLLRDTCWER
jgi:hypothetical protein